MDSQMLALVPQPGTWLWAAAAAASLTGLGSLLAALGSRRKTFEELRSETRASASVKWVDGLRLGINTASSHIGQYDTG